MVLYGTVRENPNNVRHPFQAVITDEDGEVVATFSAPTWQAADDDAKFQINRMMVAKRVRQMH